MPTVAVRIRSLTLSQVPPHFAKGLVHLPEITKGAYLQQQLTVPAFTLFVPASHARLSLSCSL